MPRKVVIAKTGRNAGKPVLVKVARTVTVSDTAKKVAQKASTQKARSKRSVIKAENSISQKKLDAACKAIEKMQKKNPAKTVLVKDVFAGVFSDLQHIDAFSLKVWAMRNPTAFYTLAAKLIPIQVSGEGGGPIVKEVVFR